MVAPNTVVLEVDEETRAFYRSGQDPPLAIDLPKVSEEDLDRLSLLGRACAEETVEFKIYPGEGRDLSQVEYHAYALAPIISNNPIFACVLAPPRCLEHMLEQDGILVESCYFQACDGHDPQMLTHALSRWAKRQFPSLTPRIEVQIVS